MKRKCIDVSFRQNNIVWRGLGCVKERFDNYCLIKSLYENHCTEIPKKKGLYIVIKPVEIAAVFCEETVAIAKFKGKSMLYDVADLEEKFKRSDQEILYIGSAINLYKRIKQLIDYGYNGKTGHRGERTLWQMENYKKFKLGLLQCEDPISEKKKFLQEYFQVYDVLPVANRRKG